jgi:predicted RNA-binding Zn-ribbon protein involved in translation (DUF1610 family)
VSVVVVTTISCDAAILRCSSCQVEIAIATAVSDVDCQLCGGTMQFEGRCETGFSLHKDSILIRPIAENKDGWHCEDRGGRDFCPTHAHLASPARSAQLPPRAAHSR